MTDEITSWEWLEDDNHFWYEERPKMIVNYYRTKPDEISVFVNMDEMPTSESISACIERALIAAGIKKLATTPRLNNWSGDTNAVWVAELVDLD